MKNERDQHINELELKVAFLTIQCFQSKIYKKQVLLQSDNKVAFILSWPMYLYSLIGSKVVSVFNECPKFKGQ